MSAMRFQHTATYDAAPAEVYAMLTDPAFRERAAQAQGVVSVEVTVTAAGEGCVVEIDQVQNTAGLPAIAKKIAGDTTRAVVKETWSSPAGGTVDISVPGKPTKAAGSVSVEAVGDGSRHVTDLEVTVKVPLVGGKLEQLMADNIRQGLEAEQAVGTAWLRGER